MSKPQDQLLLVPGESGWEIWLRQSDGSHALVRASDQQRVGLVDDLPAGELTLLFPVRSVTALPLRVMTTDESLYADMVTLHAERIGLKSDPMAGQLSDWFPIGTHADHSLLLAVFLRSPGEAELPLRGPKAFDLSARSFAVAGNAVTIWKELGRWVFAVYTESRLLYCQATSSVADDLDEAVASEIRLALVQLGIQGLDVGVARVLVWGSDRCDVSALSRHVDLPVEVTSRPVPVLCDPLSKLLPEDVRASRRAASRRRNIQLGAAAAVLLYLGVIGWFLGGFWLDSRETHKLHALAEAAAPEGEAYGQHMAKWRELADAVDLNNAPVDILNRIASCIPVNGGLRLKSADVSAASISLQGEAPQLQAVKSFSLSLTKNNGLSRYKWEMPEPSQSALGWEFRYRGSIAASDTPP